MKFSSKRRWQIIQQYIIGWTSAFIFYSIIRGEGTHELGSVQLDFVQSMVAILIGAPIMGIISGMVQILIEEHSYKRVSLQKLLVLRIIYVLVFLVSIISLTYLIYGKNLSYAEFAFEPGSLSAYLYIVSVDIFMFCLRQVNLFLGSNNLWKLFSGKFYSPREEERIFMFLDLESSTQHAERLGHVQYSKMIQDCFNDLGVVAKNDAEIYQYVGDEAILTWELEYGLKNQNCLNAFFNFKNQLERKKEYYLHEYNCYPHFKAGINSGIVTVTEVGKFKKEIAYHGDTINTAARIQNKCNELQQELVISEDLHSMLMHEDFLFDQLGSIELRGKQKSVGLFAVHMSQGSSRG